jgi:hypothetical protein
MPATEKPPGGEPGPCRTIPNTATRKWLANALVGLRVSYSQFAEFMNITRFQWTIFAWVAAFVIGLSGCATTPVSDRAAWVPNRRVVATVAPYWKVFPPSSQGLEVIPNRTFGRGTPVRFLGNRFGFSEVQLDTLERGWVPQGTLGR